VSSKEKAATPTTPAFTAVVLPVPAGRLR
jgi:hypothetical protein